MRLGMLIILLLLGLQDAAQLTYSLDDDAAFISRFEKETNELTSDSLKAYNSLKLSLFCKVINDTGKAKYYLNQGISLGKKYPLLHGASYYYMAHAQYGKLDYQYMESCFLKADSLLQKIPGKEAAKILGIVWHNYGIVQQSKGDEKAAMEVFTTKAATYARKSGDAAVLGKVNKAIAIVYMNADEREKASTYLQQATDYFEKSPQDNPTRLEEMTDTYITAAENYVYVHMPDSAIKLLNKTEKVLTPHPTSNLYLRYYFVAGIYYNELKRYDDALKYFDKGIAMSKDASSQFSANRLKFAKYQTLTHQNKYQEAAVVLEELLQSPYMVATDKKLYYKEIYSIYTKLGNNKKAIHWASVYIAYSDSLHESGFKKSLVELERKYNNVENEQKILKLQAEKEKALLTAKNNRLLNWLLGIASVSLFSLLSFGWLYYKKNKKLAEQKEINYQQQLEEVNQRQQAAFTKALMEGEEKERKRLAGDLHDGLGGMLSGVKMNLSRLVNTNKENSMNNDLYKVIDQIDFSVNELRRIARNMMPESLLHLGLEASLKDMCHEITGTETAVDFQAFNISKEIPAEMQVTIYRLIQELVTNALRHAAATEILVQCSQTENTFFITVEDNGKGFDTGSIGTHKGIGLSNVKRRVEYLKGKLDIVSTKGEGTDINIEFNVSA